MKNGNTNNNNAEDRKEIPVEMLAQVTGGGNYNSGESVSTQMPKCIYCWSNKRVSLSLKGNGVYWCDSCKKLFKANS